VLNTWNSFDIPLSSFPVVDFTSVYQFKFVGSGGKTVYLDNLYFFNDASTGISKVGSDNGINCFPNPIVDKVTVSANSEIRQVTVRNLLGQSVKTAIVNGLDKTIDLSDVASGNYFITVKLATGTVSTYKTVKL